MFLDPQQITPISSFTTEERKDTKGHFIYTKGYFIYTQFHYSLLVVTCSKEEIFDEDAIKLWPKY